MYFVEMTESFMSQFANEKETEFIGYPIQMLEIECKSLWKCIK